MAMGILAVFDLAGVDVGDLTRLARGNPLDADPTYYRPSAMLTEPAGMGKNPDADITATRTANVSSTRTSWHSFTRRPGGSGSATQPSEDEIIERCLYG